MINLYQLQLFLAVVDRGTFSAAAVELNLTQPAISLQVRALEDRYNTRLFNRQGQRLELTDAGQALIEPARRLLALAQNVEEGLRAGQGVLRGKLNLVYSSNTVNAMYVLSPILARFRTQANQVQFSLLTVAEEMAMQMLLDLQVHFAVLSSAPRHKVSQAFLLDSDPLVLATPLNHAYQDRHINVAELSGQSFVQHLPGSEERRLSDMLLRNAGLGASDTTTVGEVDNVYAVAEMVRHGLGLAFLHARLVRRLPGIGVAHLELPDEATAQLFRRETWLVRYAPAFERATSQVQNYFWDFALNDLNLNRERE